MGKKQKARQLLNKQKLINKNEEQANNQQENLDQDNKITKISKKEKRKLTKLTKINQEKKQKSSFVEQQQKDIQIEEDQQKQGIQEQIQDDAENLIEIQSSSVQQNYGNNVQFDPKGKQGFQSLINQTNAQGQTHIKSISFKSSFLGDKSETTFYLFHLKKDTFYKAIVPVHENINLTHLNQSVKLTILDGNLLKNGSYQCSSQFLENGKVKTSQIQFVKSAVFKIICNQNSQKKISTPTTKDKKQKKQNHNIQQIMKKNIQESFKPASEAQLSEIMDFLHDFQWKQDSVVICKQNLVLTETQAPFQNIDPKMLSSNGSLMILGKKNTGKSTLAEYLKNINPSSVCILDCDIGRSLTVSGCVSLITQTQNINIWVGEFTPFNCINNYVSAIDYLYQLYREKYFSKKLIINTMGYLGGLGEMIIYQIYNLVNPSEIIVLKSLNDQQVNDNLSSILYHIKAGSYLNKLLTSSPLNSNNRKGIRRFNEKKLSLNIQYLTNIHAQGKGIPIRFESLLQWKRSYKNILQLIRAVKQKQLNKLEGIKLYQQDKLGNVISLYRNNKSISDMRIVLIGKWIQLCQNEQISNGQQKQQLFQVYGIGFGFQGSIYYSQKQIQTVISPSADLKSQQISGVLSEGIDFEKNFYLINQNSLIEHQLNYGPIPYIMPIIKGMGSKGTRNNPSKNS